MFRTILAIRSNFVVQRYARFCVDYYGGNNENEKKGKNAKRKVKETVELIKLVGMDGKIMGLKTKQEALVLAKKHNVNLVMEHDAGGGKIHATYKLVSSSAAFKATPTTPKSSSQRTLKKLPLNSRITDRDLQIKMNTASKWLEKDCEVHVAIMGTGDTPELRKSLFKKIEEQMKTEARLLDIRNKEDGLKFILKPSKEKPPAPAAKEEPAKDQ